MNLVCSLLKTKNYISHVTTLFTSFWPSSKLRIYYPADLHILNQAPRYIGPFFSHKIVLFISLYPFRCSKVQILNKCCFYCYCIYARRKGSFYMSIFTDLFHILANRVLVLKVHMPAGISEEIPKSYLLIKNRFSTVSSSLNTGRCASFQFLCFIILCK